MTDTNDPADETPEAGDDVLDSAVNAIADAIGDAPKAIQEAIKLALAGHGRAVVAIGTADLLSDMAEDAAAALSDDTFVQFLDSLNDEQLEWVHALLHIEQESTRWHMHGLVTFVQRERDRSQRAQTIAPLHQHDERIDPDAPRGAVAQPQSQDSGGVRMPRAGENVHPLDDAPGSGGPVVGSPDDERE